MRVPISAAAAALLVVTAGLCVIAFSWAGGRASARERAAHEATAPPLRRLAAVNPVEPAQFDRQLAHLMPGHVVLDLRALESLEAAEDLAVHWRRNHPPEAELVCWLRPNGDDAALANAVKTLSTAGCSVLNVALEARDRLAAASVPAPAPARAGETSR